MPSIKEAWKTVDQLNLTSLLENWGWEDRERENDCSDLLKDKATNMADISDHLEKHVFKNGWMLHQTVIKNFDLYNDLPNDAKVAVATTPLHRHRLLGQEGE